MTAINRLTGLLNDLEALGSLVREARGDERQEDLCIRAGITPVHLSRIENGLASPSKTVLRSLILALETRYVRETR